MTVNEQKFDKPALFQFAGLDQTKSTTVHEKKGYEDIVKGYLAMGIAGAILAPGLAASSAVLLIMFFIPGGGSGFGFFVVFAAFGMFINILLSIVIVAVSAAPGILMMIFGFHFYKKYKDQKMPDPFMQIESKSNSFQAGLKLKLGKGGNK